MPADISSRPGRRARNIARAALACSVMMLAVWTSGAAVIRTGELDGGQLPAPIQLGEPLPLGAAGVVERWAANIDRETPMPNLTNIFVSCL